MLQELYAIFTLLRQNITFSNFVFVFVFLFATIEWNNQDSSLRTSTSVSVLKEKVLNFKRPCPSSFFNYHNLKEIKLITRLRLGLNHIREHKFKHSF